MKDRKELMEWASESLDGLDLKAKAPVNSARAGASGMSAKPHFRHDSFNNTMR